MIKSSNIKSKAREFSRYKCLSMHYYLGNNLVNKAMLTSKTPATAFEGKIIPDKPFLITTPNLILRPLIYQDIQTITAAVNEGLADLKMWLPWIANQPNQAESEQIAKTFHQEAKEEKVCHLMVYNNQEFIGMVSLYNSENASQVVKLGYWFKVIADTSVSHVFMESLRAILQFAFDEWGILKLTIPCVAGNFFNEVAAKELKFKLKRIDLVDGKSLKIYELKSFELINTIEMTVIHNTL